MHRVHLHDFMAKKIACQSGVLLLLLCWVFFVCVCVCVCVCFGGEWGEEGVLCLLDKSQFQWLVITLNQHTRELIISARNT